MGLERIKCRAKDKFTDRWVYGFPRKTPLGNWVIYNGERRYCIIPETLGQYTGLRDKNGKEIYEGDILSTDLAKSVCEVIFRNGCFVLRLNDGGEDFYDILSPLEDDVTQTKYHSVVGNIFDNPNLLNKEQ